MTKENGTKVPQRPSKGEPERKGDSGTNQKPGTPKPSIVPPATPKKK